MQMLVDERYVHVNACPDYEECMTMFQRWSATQLPLKPNSSGIRSG